MDISLYLHIPFCKKKCKYCDFVSINARDEFVARYVSALEKEIEMQGKAYEMPWSGQYFSAEERRRCSRRRTFHA
ncbi:MAG: hypothetical protein L6V82_07890 [Clostridiales bacterium]|nr:MAG: hypothetical protein L6V82_07890 [Clostridiales bacterium]